MNDYRDYLLDMLERIERVEQIQSQGRQFFSKNASENGFPQDGVRYNLAVIGEIVRRLPTEIQNMAPQIEWRKIVNFRNVLVHDYRKVGEKLVWQIMEDDLLPLKKAIQDMLHRLSQDKPND